MTSSTSGGGSELDAPLNEVPGSQVGRAYLVEVPHPDELASLFPAAASSVGPAQVAAIGALSRFVGMVCPGLHSVFASTRFALGEPRRGPSPLRFVVTRYDDRYKLFIVRFNGVIDGELRAFVRPPPQDQPSMQQVRKLVSRGEFAGVRSLVIGGSRGLGEVVAKILVAGGADADITYARGMQDAHRVAAEINAAQCGRCGVFEFDVARDPLALPAVDVGRLSSVFYFATPRIFRKTGRVFDHGAFDEFTDIYVKRFAAFCTCLDRKAREGRIAVYWPSTVALDERPRGMIEYTMAKAAGELLAAELSRSLDHVSVMATRLPRLSTDQTSTILRVPTQPVLDVLLPIVREMHRRPGTPSA